MSRDSMEFDVVIVGAGPAGLAVACRLAQLAKASRREIAIGVLHTFGWPLDAATDGGGFVYHAADVELERYDERAARRGSVRSSRSGATSVPV